MQDGWFVGGFEPTAFNTYLCEVGVKNYKAGDRNLLHYHKLATEINYIIDGAVKMNGVLFTTGDIVIVKPNEATDFLAIIDTKMIVVKTPGHLNDKYSV